MIVEQMNNYDYVNHPTMKLSYEAGVTCSYMVEIFLAIILALCLLLFHGY